jgi:hypothetical protein
MQPATLICWRALVSTTGPQAESVLLDAVKQVLQSVFAGKAFAPSQGAHAADVGLSPDATHAVYDAICATVHDEVCGLGGVQRGA